MEMTHTHTHKLTPVTQREKGCQVFRDPPAKLKYVGSQIEHFLVAGPGGEESEGLGDSVAWTKYETPIRMIYFICYPDYRLEH